MIRIPLSLDAKQAIAALRNFRSGIKKSGDEFKNVGMAAKRVNKETAQGAINIKEMALKTGAFAAATTGVVALWRELNRLMDDAKGKLQGTAPAFGQLIQISGGSREKFNELSGAAADLTRRAPIDLNQAASLVFQLESLGEFGNRNTFADLINAVGSENIAGLVESVGTLKNALGTRETGTTEQILSKLFAGSATSKTTVSQLAPASVTAAAGARQIGSSDEELLSAVSVLAKGSRTADVAGTQVAALAKFIDAEGIGGQGFLSAIDQISGDAGLQQRLREGRQEAFRAFAGLTQNRQEFVAQTRLLGDENRTLSALKGNIDLSRRTGVDVLDAQNNLTRAENAAALARSGQVAKELNDEAAVLSAQSRSSDGINAAATGVSQRTINFLENTAGRLFGEDQGGDLERNANAERTLRNIEKNTARAANSPNLSAQGE